MLNKNNDIESLRAIAILFVIVVHVNVLLQAPLAPFTWMLNHYDLTIGVDLFFVISGYVITNSLYRLESEAHQPKWRLVASFWIRRFFRLAPTAFLWLFVTAAFVIFRGYVLESSGVGRAEFAAVMAGLLHVVNLYSAYCTNSPESTLCGAYYIHGHYWSLSLEEQFYLFIPFLFFFMKRRLLVVLLVSTILVLLTIKRPYWSYGWAFRVDGFCWGILLAMLHKQFSFPLARSFFANRAVRWVSLLVLCALLPFVSQLVQGWGDNAKTYGIGVIAMLCAAIVWVATFAPNDDGAGRFGVDKVLVLIGARSYTLYVSHLIIFFIVDDLWDRSSYFGALKESHGVVSTLLLVSICLVLTILATELNYRLVETRIRKVGRRVSDKLLSKPESADRSQLVAAGS